LWVDPLLAEADRQIGGKHSCFFLESAL
jgi:hypothetical protein